MLRGILTTFIFSALLSTSMAAEKTISLKFEQKNRSDVEKSDDSFDQEFYSIKEVTVTELDDDVAGDVLPNTGHEKNLGQVIMAADKLLAFGRKIWAIVEAGKPVVSTNFKPITVLPNVDGTDSAFYQMEGWRGPAGRRYRVVYKNGFGMEVVKFTYTVLFEYNGSLENTGRYITGAHVSASDVSVMWGFNFDASSSLIAIANRGSQRNPVASATIKVGYVVKSVIKEIRTSETFYITGTGSIGKY